MKTQITVTKLARYPELLEGPVRPIHWDVDPSLACDHRCKGCPYIFSGPADPMLGVARDVRDPRLLKFDAFVLFLEQAKLLGARAITFVGGGEPTVHPRFIDMVRAARELDLKFGLVSHFSRDYPKELFGELAGATWIRVSLNAGTPKTYERHQGRASFDAALNNIARAAVIGCRIGVSYLVTQENFREIALAAHRVKVLGAKYIQVKPYISISGYEAPDFPQRVEKELGKARRFADASFQVIDQWSARRAELRKHEHGQFSGSCHVPRFNPKLGADGVVYGCCELAYSSEHGLGSIYSDPLETILGRAEKWAVDMARCPNCWAKSVNKAINEGRLSDLEPPPESDDQEFV